MHNHTRFAIAIFAVTLLAPTAALAAPTADDGGASAEVADATTSIFVSPTAIAETRANLRTELATLYTRLATQSVEIERTDESATPAAWTSGRQTALRSPLVDELEATKARFEEAEAQLQAINERFAQDSPWADFNLEFAVFPVDNVDEFVNSWGNSRSGGRRHKGTDILAPHGTSLFAIEDGVIERTSNSSLGGLSVYLLGDSGARYYYTHLSELGPFVAGDVVSAGQVIGLNGDSGNARGTPHLHFQVAPDGGDNWVNPYPLLLALWQFERNAEGPPERVWG